MGRCGCSCSCAVQACSPAPRTLPPSPPPSPLHPFLPSSVPLFVQQTQPQLPPHWMLRELSVLCRTEEQSIDSSIRTTTEQIVRSPPSRETPLQSPGPEWGPGPMGSQPTCLASEHSSDRVPGTVGQKRGELDTCPQREGETTVGEEGMEVGLSVPTAGSAVAEVSGRPPLYGRSEGRGGSPGRVPRSNVQKRDPPTCGTRALGECAGIQATAMGTSGRETPLEGVEVGDLCPHHWTGVWGGHQAPSPPGQRGPQCIGVWRGTRLPPPPGQRDP